MQIFNYWLIVFFFIVSCKNDTNVKNEYYFNGQIKSVTTYNGKMRDGIAKTFYKDGSLKEVFFYVNNSRNGKYLSYDNKGNKDGEGFFWRDSLVGPNYFYNNNRLELYNESDYNGGIYYVKKYDLTGKLIKEEGIAISPNFYSSLTSDTISINKKVALYFFYSEPESYKNYLEASVNGEPITITYLPSHVGLIEKSILNVGQYHFEVKAILKHNEQTISQDYCVKTITAK